MKEELPENYKNKGEDSGKQDSVIGDGSESSNAGVGETKAKLSEEKLATSESGSPGEGNVATAAAAALASAAVKAKVIGTEWTRSWSSCYSTSALGKC